MVNTWVIFVLYKWENRQMKRARHDQPNWKMIIILFYMVVFFLRTHTHTHTSSLIVITIAHTFSPKHLACMRKLHRKNWNDTKAENNDLCFGLVFLLLLLKGKLWKYKCKLHGPNGSLTSCPYPLSMVPLQCCILQMSTICLENIVYLFSMNAGHQCVWSQFLFSFSVLFSILFFTPNGNTPIRFRIHIFIIRKQQQWEREKKKRWKLTDNNYTILSALHTLLGICAKTPMCDVEMKQNEKTDKIGFIFGFCHDLNRVQRWRKNQVRFYKVRDLSRDGSSFEATKYTEQNISNQRKRYYKRNVLLSTMMMLTTKTQTKATTMMQTTHNYSFCVRSFQILIEWKSSRNSTTKNKATTLKRRRQRQTDIVKKRKKRI